MNCATVIGLLLLVLTACTTSYLYSNTSLVVPPTVSPAINHSPQGAPVAITDNLLSCVNITGGWQCRLNAATLQESTASPEQLLVQANHQLTVKQQICSAQRGKWYCPGFCKPYYDHNCYLPLTDAGTPCNANQMCTGSCVLNENLTAARQVLTTLAPNWTHGDIPAPHHNGTCSKYLLHPCEPRIEVNDGQILDRTGLRCD